MAEREFPSNSDKSKAERKEAKKPETRSSLQQEPPVTTDRAKKKEKGPIDELIHTFIVEDIPSVKREVMITRIIPDLKRLIGNAAKDTIDLLLGETRLDNRRERSSLDRGQTGYGRRNNASSYSNRSDTSSSNRGGYGSNSGGFDSRDYTFPNRGKAEEVLEILRNDVYECGKASVATFLTNAGYAAAWSDYDIGWTNLDEDCSRIRSVPEGYCVLLPRPISIKDL